MLRITGANSNATAFNADTIAQKTTDKLTENISTGKPQSTNGLNFRKFGGKFVTLNLIFTNLKHLARQSKMFRFSASGQHGTILVARMASRKKHANVS